MNQKYKDIEEIKHSVKHDQGQIYWIMYDYLMGVKNHREFSVSWWDNVNETYKTVYFNKYGYPLDGSVELDE